MFTSFVRLGVQFRLHPVNFHATNQMIGRRRRAVVMMIMRTDRSNVRRVLVIHRSRSGYRISVIGCSCSRHRRSGRCRRRITFRFALARLNAIFSHGKWTVDTVKFMIQSASIADRFTFRVSAPKSRRRRSAIGATKTQPPSGTLCNIFDVCMSNRQLFIN